MSTEWRAQAVCIGQDPVEFDLETEKAYWTCERCPVLLECREDAMQPETAGGSWGPGIRGGLTLTQRVALKRHGRYRPADWQIKPKRANPGLLSKAEHQRRYALWLEGLSDVDMAEQLAVTTDTVRSWRLRFRTKGHPEGLPSNKPAFKPITKEQMALRINLAEAGFNDGYIAEQCGVTASAIQTWRKRWERAQGKNRDRRTA